MKKQIRQFACLVLIITVLFTLAFPAVSLAASDPYSSNITIQLKAGSTSMQVNGKAQSIQKPYLKGKVFFIPVKAVMEALGAEVNLSKSGKTQVFFHEVSMELTAGQNKMTVNQTQKVLSAAPTAVKNVLMAPVETVREFPNIKFAAGKKAGEYIITLVDDGALSDLSFLLGSVTKPRIGNSYFGWSLSVPKGSRLTTQSFNSRSIQILNEHRSIVVDVYVELQNGKGLRAYYEEILDNPYDTLDGEIVGSSIQMTKTPAFAEFLYTDSYEEAVYHRIYAAGGYFYSVVITSYEESDPEILKEDPALESLMNSFALGYRGGRTDTVDLSKVKDGMAEYDHYILMENSEKKYATWEIWVLPEWDLIQERGGNPFQTKIGVSKKENLLVEMSHVKDAVDAETQGTELEDYYLSNFNPQYFKMLQSGNGKTSGQDSYNLQYELKLGKTLYRYDERIFVIGELVFDLSYKAPADAFEKGYKSYLKMLETFKPTLKDVPALQADMDKYAFNKEKTRLGEEDEMVDYANKPYGWKAVFPGIWQKGGQSGQSFEYFYNQKNGAAISVEAVSRKSPVQPAAEGEQFNSVAYLVGKEAKPEKTETIEVKGKPVKKVVYRIDDEAAEMFQDYTFYFVDGETYSYCFAFTIPDICVTEGNTKQLEDIWASFTLTPVTDQKQTQDQNQD